VLEVCIKQAMTRDFEKPFNNIQLEEPPPGLFDRIISAIKREQELRHTKRLLLGFLFLLVVSVVATPISGVVLKNQIENSGLRYFISAAFSNFGTFFSLWQDFSLAILESLPLAAITIFAISLGISVFTLRLFLYKKRLLLNYLMHNFA
jgi:hypothetical protein